MGEWSCLAGPQRVVPPRCAASFGCCSMQYPRGVGVLVPPEECAITAFAGKAAHGLVQSVYLACEAYVVVFQGRYLVVLLLDDAAALRYLPTPFAGRLSAGAPVFRARPCVYLSRAMRGWDLRSYMIVPVVKRLVILDWLQGGGLSVYGGATGGLIWRPATCSVGHVL